MQGFIVRGAIESHGHTDTNQDDYDIFHQMCY